MDDWYLDFMLNLLIILTKNYIYKCKLNEAKSGGNVQGIVKSRLEKKN